MKLMYFNDYRLGVLKGDTVVDITTLVSKIAHTGPGDLISGLIAAWAVWRAPIEKAVAEGSGLPLTQIRIRPPLPRPGNIDCMAVNYMEDGTSKEPAPINAFHKASSASSATARPWCCRTSRPHLRGRGRTGAGHRQTGEQCAAARAMEMSSVI